MAKYKVKSLAISGIGKKIYRSGNEVTESDFPKGNAQKLVEQGHLIEIKSATKKSTSKVDK